jgi:hypothetical protein
LVLEAGQPQADRRHERLFFDGAAWGKGGKKRMAALSPQERKDLARKAAQARWGKARNKVKRPAKTGK